MHALGIRIALDDFGAGYTSLAQLRNLPISELKIDRSFVTSMNSNRDDALIVHSMVDLGHSLSMKVVAEGIETAEAGETLAGFGCDIGQGFHLSRPVSAEALLHWHDARPSVPAPAANVRKFQPSGFVALRAV